MNPRFESVLQDAGSSFHLAHFECESFSSDHTWHYHPEYELAWIVRSSGTRLVGNSVRPYQANDLVLLGPGLPHCWHSDDSQEPDTRPEVYLAQFSPTFLGEDFFALPEARSVRQLLKEAVQGLHFGDAVANEVGPMLKRAMTLSGLERIGCLLNILERLAASPRTPLATADHLISHDLSLLTRRRIETVYQYLRENLSGHICQADIAASLSMTPPEFSKFFRAATGQTFVSFINVLRVNEACRLLIGTEINVTRVAMECGYNNLSHFNRQFLRHKGITPSDFRKGGTLPARRIDAGSERQ